MKDRDTRARFSPRCGVRASLHSWRQYLAVVVGYWSAAALSKMCFLDVGVVSVLPAALALHVEQKR